MIQIIQRSYLTCSQLQGHTLYLFVAEMKKGEKQNNPSLMTAWAIVDSHK